MTSKTIETRWHYWQNDKVAGYPYCVGYDYGRFTNQEVYNFKTEAEAKAFVDAANVNGRIAGFQAAEALFSKEA